MFLRENTVVVSLLHKHQLLPQKLKGRVISLPPCGFVRGKKQAVVPEGCQGSWELGLLLGSALCHTWAVLAGRRPLQTPLSPGLEEAVLPREALRAVMLAGTGPSYREPGFVLICYLDVLIKHSLREQKLSEGLFWCPS